MKSLNTHPKTLPLLLLFLLAALLQTTLAAAQFQLPAQQPTETTTWLSSLVFDCAGACLEGNVAAWQVQIQNLGDKEFSLTEVGLVDTQGTVFAKKQVSEKLGRQAVATAVLQALVPPPTRGWTLYYKACFLINNRTECEAGDRIMLVMPLSAVECLSNEGCRQSEQCTAFKCKPLECALGETAFNHSCTPKTIQEAKATELRVEQTAVYVLLALVLVVTAANTYQLLKIRRARR